MSVNCGPLKYEEIFNVVGFSTNCQTMHRHKTLWVFRTLSQCMFALKGKNCKNTVIIEGWLFWNGYFDDIEHSIPHNVSKIVKNQWKLCNTLLLLLNLLATNIWWTIPKRNNSRFSFNPIQNHECLTHLYVVLEHYFFIVKPSIKALGVQLSNFLQHELMTLCLWLWFWSP